MFANWSDHLSNSVTWLVFFILTLAVLAFVVFKAFRDWSDYGTLSFMSQPIKWVGGIAAVALFVQSFMLSQPFVPKPSPEFAIVVGNTANTPRPQIDENLTEQIEKSMLAEKDRSADEIVQSIALVSATDNPQVIDVSDEGLRGLDGNDRNSSRNARENAAMLAKQVNSAKPASHGANYLEAILLAGEQVGPGSNLIVIGSGLSDSGEFNFAKDNLLTFESNRSAALVKIAEENTHKPLRGYSVTFYGLGDTTAPQEALTKKQRDVVRQAYRDLISALGGRAIIITDARSGPSVETDFRVSTTDTGCGDWEGTFREDSVQFVPNTAEFKDPAKAKAALAQVFKIYDRNPAAVRSIDVHGYIADVRADRSAPADPGDLSGARARAVKKVLVSLGVPEGKVSAVGKKFGPHKDQNKNRFVRVAVERDSAGCEE